MILLPPTTSKPGLVLKESPFTIDREKVMEVHKVGLSGSAKGLVCRLHIASQQWFHKGNTTSKDIRVYDELPFPIDDIIRLVDLRSKGVHPTHIIERKYLDRGQDSFNRSPVAKMYFSLEELRQECSQLSDETWVDSFLKTLQTNKVACDQLSRYILIPIVWNRKSNM